MVWKTGADQERDAQDVVERHVYSELSFDAGGAKVHIKGNGTEDVDVPVLFVGQLHNLPKDTDAEVHLVGNGSDTDLKLAFITGPRDKHYKSKAGESWGQDPLDPDVRHGYTPNGLRFAAKGGKTIAEWSMGLIEVDVDNKLIYFRGDVKSDKIFHIEVQAKQPPPAFKQ